ncbi:MAG: C-GCAxxG-C-C family protein [Desulfovibrionaceae bacterium]|nr:C-GCAxxG-C-C family protein [Desulfovibrionaceae bacterium]
MDHSRRTLLGAMGGLAVGGTLAAMTGNVIAAPAAPAMTMSEGKNGHFAQLGGEFGWEPHKLDPAYSAAVAYEGYWYKGYACGYGTFYGIIGLMAEKYGAPYNAFPFTMFEANKGGISDWGTICGALYGAAAAFSCFYPRKEATPMVNELFRWYEVTAFPLYQPGDAAQGVKGDIPSSVANSVLCHISVSRWCYNTKLAANSKERSERCGRITADVCMKAVEILNAKIDGGKDWKGALAKQESVVGCTSCHGKDQVSDMQKGNMDCTPCHSGSDALTDKFNNHPA